MNKRVAAAPILTLLKTGISSALGQSPEEWDTTFENNGVIATVVIRQGGAEETYLLLQEDQEWGLGISLPRLGRVTIQFCEYRHALVFRPI